MLRTGWAGRDNVLGACFGEGSVAHADIASPGDVAPRWIVTLAKGPTDLMHT
jgi:hypothetical protein